MKNLIVLTLVAASISGCSDADVASSNLSKAADQFEITRRIVFYNGITGDYILTIQGLCSLGNNDTNQKLSVALRLLYSVFILFNKTLRR